VVCGARVGAAQEAQSPDGAALFRQNCRSCHGARGKPSEQMKGVYPGLVTLSDSAVQAKLTVDGIVTLLTNGNGKDMKPFAGKMSKDEMRSVAEFVMALKPGAASP
jgi:mono/diheme cytochrome c family protein